MRPSSSTLIVLSHITVAPALEARARRQTSALTSLDLRVTQSEVSLDDEGVLLPDGQRLAWDAIDEIAANETSCYRVANGMATKIQAYSEAFNRYYALYPTRRAPTMLLSGIPMHRIKNVDPWQDTELKMKTIGPVMGDVLDICTGLGYTAIAAARSASRVTTVEVDPTVLDICHANPWSQPLFDNPKIEQRIGDATEVVPELGGDSFSRIFHDPPAFRIAGELYSGEFYRELFRVLKRGGRLYHYIGDLDSTTGRVVAKGVVRRLQEVGFEQVTRRPEAFGLVTSK